MGDLIKPRSHAIGVGGCGDWFGFGWETRHQLFHQDLGGALFVAQGIEFGVHALRVALHQQIGGQGFADDFGKIRPARFGVIDERSMKMGREAVGVSCHVSIKARPPGGQKVLKRDARRNVSQ